MLAFANLLRTGKREDSPPSDRFVSTEAIARDHVPKNDPNGARNFLAFHYGCWPV
jgi:hypothetical protein